MTKDDDKRKIRVRQDDGSIKYLSTNELTHQPILHNILDETLVSRIQWVFGELKSTMMIENPCFGTLEQFEIMFMRSAEPNKDVTIWENIVKAFHDAKKRFKADGPDRDGVILRILMLNMTDSLTEEEKEREDVKIILQVYNDIITAE